MLTSVLGTSGIEVSRMALGSWRTFERLSRDEGLAVMLAARRAAGWPRAETVVANKLWWEFCPDQSAAAELDASLARMQFDDVDVIYANPPENGLELEELVESVAALVDSGKARAWAIVNWPAAMLSEDADPNSGRAAGSLDDPRVAATAAVARQLADLARRLDTTPASLAIAFILANPKVATVLFGATRPDQVRQNVEALAVANRLDSAHLVTLRGLHVAE